MLRVRSLKNHRFLQIAAQSGQGMSSFQHFAYVQGGCSKHRVLVALLVRNGFDWGLDVLVLWLFLQK